MSSVSQNNEANSLGTNATGLVGSCFPALWAIDASHFRFKAQRPEVSNQNSVARFVRHSGFRGTDTIENLKLKAEML
tara:strand:+ start:197 stop:427 length:231 start_codon:yes stop_codon:yes gene_type:complete